MKWLPVLCLLAACGDDAPPVDGDLTKVPEVTVACDEVPLPASKFEHGSDLSPAVAGTLAGWDPNGRWFLTGIRVGSPSSFQFSDATGSLVVDKEPSYAAS